MRLFKFKKCNSLSSLLFGVLVVPICPKQLRFIPGNVWDQCGFSPESILPALIQHSLLVFSVWVNGRSEFISLHRSRAEAYKYASIQAKLPVLTGPLWRIGAHRNIQSRNSHFKCRGTKNLPQSYMFSLDIEAVETNGSRKHHDNLTCNRSPSNINIHVCWMWTESVPWHLVMKRTWRVSKLASHQSREKTHFTQNSGCSADAFHVCAVGLVLTRPTFHCDRHQQFGAARRRQFEKMSFPETHKITSSSTGRVKGSEDFMFVTF